MADFLKGVDWLLKSDGEKLHKEIMAAGYKAEPLENLDVPFSYPEYDRERHKKSSPINKLKRILTLNGYLLRTRGNVSYFGCLLSARLMPIEQKRFYNMM